jgi:hypothetical protein
VRVEDTGGNPVTGLTIVIEENNPPCTGTYTSAVSDSNGNYGPTGFTINSARSYFQIAQAFVDNGGNLQDCTRITSTSRAIRPSMRIIVTMGISPIPQGSPAGRSSLPQAPASIAINLPD